MVEGTLGPGNIGPWEHGALGTLGPGNIGSLEQTWSPCIAPILFRMNSRYLCIATMQKKIKTGWHR